MLRIIFLIVLAWLLYKLMKPIIFNLFGPADYVKQKKTSSKKQQTFQEKHKDKIEDADYEDLDEK
jgi:hypothetical protein